MTINEMSTKLTHIACDLAFKREVYKANQLIEIRDELDARLKQMVEISKEENQEAEIEKLQEVIAAQDVRIDQLRKEVVERKNAHKEQQLAEKREKATKRGKKIMLGVSAIACAVFLVLWIVFNDNTYAWLSLTCASFALLALVASISFARDKRKREGGGEQ